ncbi:family 43 glycoside hydrolase [Podospora aff. communis PSN243]|uniref:Family 43 glycoside hydrolase n=1 Tax=Podospora aff. communis PSN243 TaxID=3040156 RepID=A0AAV9GSM1_9PEZI|nr:family 43 glycoside hydrolase [Podospora aff. communis PSN243]
MHFVALSFILAWMTILRPTHAQTNHTFVGYLISTFSDPNPTVQWHLSKGNDPSTYSFLNRGQPILRSTVGTKAVRDVFLVTNSARDEWFMICTDLDVTVPGFSWDRVTRTGSRSMVIWKSKDLINWSGPTLTLVEDPTAGMLWAPSAVWDDTTSQYHVFWSSQLYEPSDPSHRGTATPKRIRYATTKDFLTFTPPKDYLAPPNRAIIDQEFLPLGKPGHFARFYKDETAGSRVVIETSTTGLFGTWKTVGNVRTEGRREGPAAWADNRTPGKYYLLLDDYTQYLPYETSDIGVVPWGVPNWPAFPRGLKHGCVTPLTEGEYEAVRGRYLA